MQSESYHLLGVDSSLERLENLNLNLGSELLLLGGSSVGKALGLSEVGTDSLEYEKTVEGKLVKYPWSKSQCELEIGQPSVTSALNSSTGKASTALMLREESGFMVAKPPETIRRR
jgi:hypothetical protein